MTNQTEQLLARRKRFLSPTYQAFYDQPVHLVRGEGIWLFDTEGNRYLDAYNNVVSVGHCHPHVVAAISRQAAILNTHTRYLHELVVDYAERLLATVPSDIGHAIFTCTGSEANDLALRIAEYATGGTGVVITRWAYHGGTIATTALSPSAGSPLGAHHRAVPAPDTFRNGGRDATDFAKNVQTAMQDMVDNGIKPSALLIDGAFSSDGIFLPDAHCIASAAEAARGFGALVIADEVQPGFGRLGTGMWGFTHYGIDADIVTMGKPMGDGHPIGGLLLRPELVEGFGSIEGYFNTFGGNPVAAAAGLAVLDVIEREGLIANARDSGIILQKGLSDLKGRHVIVSDVRGSGLYWGVEIGADADLQTKKTLTRRIVNGMRARRVLISSCGEADNVLKIRPPLCFSAGNAAQLVETLDQVLSDFMLKLERETLNDRAYGAIKQGLISGHFRPGQALVIRTLANEFGISTTPIREALQRLVAERILTHQQNRSIAVPLLSADTFGELMRVRCAVEGLAAEMAAEHIKPKHLQGLRKILHRIDRAISRRDGKSYLALNEEFHFSIYEKAEAPILLGVIRDLWGRAGPYMNYLAEIRSFIAHGNDWHSKTVAAFEEGRRDVAKHCVVLDISSAAKVMTSLVEKEFTSGGANVIAAASNPDIGN